MSKPNAIDVTPTWAAVLPILIAAIENGNEKGRKAAREELLRMAQAADKFNAARDEANRWRAEVMHLQGRGQ
jgi:hypothetical protein